MTKHMRACVTLAAVTMLLAGCAGSQQARDVQQSGFLGQDYERLRPGEEGEALLVYRNPDAPWRSYDRIKLAPVTIWAGEDSELEDFRSRSDRSLPSSSAIASAPNAALPTARPRRHDDGWT